MKKRSEVELYRPIVVLLLTLFLLSCAHMNERLRDCCVQGEAYSLDHASQPAGADDTFVVLTFSGGGTRAAALAYGVLEKLWTIKLPNTGKTVLDEVDIISTVSGGSFTGAYYALFGEKTFVDFKERFLHRKIEQELALKVANPINGLRLLSPNFGRSDLAAELYDKTIFEGQTYGDLARKGHRPFLIVNATNLLTGSRFEFTSRQFRYLGSDLLSYPVARAVAASSAFPFLLTPITLENYPLGAGKGETGQEACQCAPKITRQDESALEGYELNKRRYYAAYYNTLYQNSDDHPYVHLMDGGLADNVGLRVIDDLFARDEIRRKINEDAIQRLAVIVVNAKTSKKEDFDRTRTPPGLTTIGMKTATISMDNYTFETIEKFRDSITQRIETQWEEREEDENRDGNTPDSAHADSLAGGKMKLYVIDLGFENLGDPGEREFFLNLPTSFSLKDEEVRRLIEVGGRLLVEHPEFTRFICGFYGDANEREACIARGVKPSAGP
ncbi:MAG: Patatin-like phospholipase [Syntrophorhabdus sp. PtaU1.Bin050]|nr:MAG: Patatin-like phospholipase [Syntrophorhabdus sp. PtaU1.Bin050]